MTIMTATRPPRRRTLTAEPIRVSVSLAPPAAKWLGDEAKRRGIAMSEVIRRLIDEARQDYILEERNRSNPK